MTICKTMDEPLDKRLKEKKSLEQIGIELCPGVRDSRDKALRLVIRFKGKKFLQKNADWLGYDVKQIRNPKGRTGRKKFRQQPKESKEDQIIRIRGYITDAGFDWDLFPIRDIVGSDVSYHENLEKVQEAYPQLKPHCWKKWEKYKDMFLEGFKEFPVYDDLLKILDIALFLVRTRNVNGWQHIEDIIEKNVMLDSSIWKYTLLEVYQTPTYEEPVEEPPDEVTM